MTTTLRALAALCLGSLALAGCGSTSGSGANPASVAPETSFLYAEATIDPDGSQEDAMRSILADLPGNGAPQGRLEELIRNAVREDNETTKLDWDKDIKPWLGDKVAGFVGTPTGGQGIDSLPAAVVVATTDEAAARDALEKDKEPGASHRRYRDIEYIVESDGEGGETAEGVVDGFVVEGSDAGMKAAIDASKAKTLADTDRFKEAVDKAPDERVGFAYMDFGGLIQLASQAAGGQIPGGALFGRLAGGKPIVVIARAENQALVFEGSGSVPAAEALRGSGDPRALIESLPGGSWAALALPGFGDAVRSLVTGFAGALGGEQALTEQLRQATGLDLEQDVLSWIGDVGLFVDGESKDTIGGGVVIKSRDPEKSKRALTKIAAAIAKNDPSTHVAAADVPGAFGYRLSNAETRRGIYMVQAGDKVAMTYGEDEARKALSGGGLGADADFKRASERLGGDYSPALYVAVPPILRLADASGAASDKDYTEAKPYLTIFDYLIAGSHDGSSRLRVGFKPHG